jgi:GAF domain-containing protein
MFWKLVNLKEWQKNNEELREMAILLRDATSIAGQVQNGNLDMQLSSDLLKTELGKSLDSMVKHLRRIKSEAENRAWVDQGLTVFFEILKNKKAASFSALLDKVLSELTRYVRANQGAIFLLEKGETGDYIKMVSCYAYNKKKYFDRRQSLTEGLAGQCILERDSIYLRKIPHDYVHITSGLGEATPRNIFITPLMINDTVLGVIELASFADFDPVTQEFIKKVAESISSFIKSGMERKQLEEVLSFSQGKAEELRLKEDEMRQNLEIMTSLQEQLARNEIDLKRQLREMQEELNRERDNEIDRIRDEEKALLESKLEAQKKSYELIINRLKSKLTEVVLN